MVSGFDIIFFWIARMIMMTMHFIKDENGKPQVPFHTVYMTGLISVFSGQPRVEKVHSAEENQVSSTSSS